MNVHRLLCFGSNDESGNAAIIVEDSHFAAEPERLKFARQQDANATVFVETDAGGARLDYYYQNTRSPLCLHATLAASAVFFERYPERWRTQFVTGMHRHVLEAERFDHGIFVGVRAQPCPILSQAVTETARLLRVEPTALIGIPRLASVGITKLLVQMKGQIALDALNPDLKAIASWSREHGVAGVFAYCHHNNDIYAGRNFNHLEPHLEDAATGVAARRACLGT